MQLKEFILANIDQISIFSKYFGISEEEIRYNINSKNDRIRNPLRIDKHPSLSFRYYGDKLICRDFADGRFRGDVFEVVGYILNKNCKVSNDFNYICNDIILKCLKDIKNNIEFNISEQEHINKKNLIISFDIRTPNKLDYNYWEQYGIKKENINTKLFVVDRYKLNDWQTPYRYSGSDPCYAYNVNPNKYKLYFPYRNKHKMKFITNNKCPIECLHQLVNTDYIVLIKGYKDKILCEQICKEKGINNILFLPAASETIVLPEDIYNILISHSNSKKIFTIFDTDAAGINAAQSLQSKYGIIPIYFTNTFKSKDPSDMVKDYSYRKVFQHFDNVLKKIYYGN